MEIHWEALLLEYQVMLKWEEASLYQTNACTYGRLANVLMGKWFWKKDSHYYSGLMEILDLIGTILLQQIVAHTK